jgi:hypothetical protein
MTDLSNIRNSGIFIGGNSNSSITVGGTGPTGSLSETEVLSQLDSLFTRLVTDILQLPPEQAGAAAYQTAELRAAVTAPHRDPGRIQAFLVSLKGTVAVAAPLVEIVKAIAELIAELH